MDGGCRITRNGSTDGMDTRGWYRHKYSVVKKDSMGTKGGLYMRDSINRRRIGESGTKNYSNKGYCQGGRRTSV